jgi:hypothetical protein
MYNITETLDPSVDAEKLDLEVERCVGRNDGREAARAVGLDVRQ